MINLTSEQLQKLRKPFDQIGAFEDHSDDEVERILKGFMGVWLALVNTSLRLRQKGVENDRNPD